MTYKQTLTVACKNTFLHSNPVENMLFANTQMVVSFTNVVTSCCREYVDIVLKHKVMPNAMPQRINKKKQRKCFEQHSKCNPLSKKQNTLKKAGLLLTQR